MTDEVAADDSGASHREELIGELVRAVLDLLDALHTRDALLEEHPRDAVHRSQTDMFNFVIRAGLLRRDLGLAPADSLLPGDAVALSVMAFADLNRGVVDPVLAAEPGRHVLPLRDQLDRVRPAVLMELLIMDGYKVEKAAKEVADRTGDSVGAIKRRWRDIKNGGAESWATTQFNDLVAEAKRLVAGHGGTSADYIKLAAAVLGSTAKKRRKRSQSRSPN